uniref:Putative secreted peptide n=1 Tax=Anopheles braziliensis TaxID=58242 RepID=A0A2M3ZNJ4_9DIPT
MRMSGGFERGFLISAMMAFTTSSSSISSSYSSMTRRVVVPVDPSPRSPVALRPAVFDLVSTIRSVPLSESPSESVKSSSLSELLLLLSSFS